MNRAIFSKEVKSEFSTQKDNWKNLTREATVGPHDFVHEMVSAQAVNHPDALAVVSPRLQLSYRELDERTDILSRYFRSIGAGPGAVVALWLRRSHWIMVAALATFKAGAAYLPLDPEAPTDRLLFTIKDSGAKIVVTDSAMADRARGANCRLVIIDEDNFWEEASKAVATDWHDQLDSDDLAYVIYTSGSTGVPKGIEITHGNLSNLISWHTRIFQVSGTDRASHLAGLGFDASVWEIWPYLAAGSALSLAECDTLKSPENLRSWLVRSGITISFVPTPMAEQMLALEWPAETKLRVLLTGGDTLHVRPVPGLPFTVFNNYGPTECTVVATSGIVPASSIPSLPSIGAPIDNTQVYILDEHLQPVPCGERGELYIAGANVGAGYRYRPELTAQSFVSNPFVSGTRMYKTGDLGSYLPSGEVAFLGRIDNQIKIRGYRIEPDEIATILNSYPGVTGSVVTLRSDSGGDKHLVAYLVADEILVPGELQKFLREHLPDYMVPSIFVRIDHLPFTANGKVDCAALPAPTQQNTLANRPAQPNSAVESKLAQVVAGLLNIPQVGPDDDFFLLGGHSLLGTQLIARIRDSFDVEVVLRILFERPTIRALAAEIERLVVARIEAMSEAEAQRVLSAS